MTTDVLLAIGGIGLFLLGMTVMSDGLRELAGPALRRMLASLTRTPARGAALGALTTAIVQSSHATVIAAVGFVSAGLLTFPQGLGIVFGANVGTTVTGWIVALIGFRFDLGTAVMPLVAVGVLMRVFLGRDRLGAAGWAMAGFGVLFIGIDTMQSGMAGFASVVTPERFPDDTIAGRLILVLIGAAITTLTQSSSASVAMALAAIGAGAISFPQGVAMVIGMNVAASLTAALATVGGSTATRRTGIAHVVFNALTGLGAFVLVEPYVRVAGPWVAAGDAGRAQIALVAFHTLFNVLGVLVALPFAGPFARLIERLVPERGAPLTARLDQTLLRAPDLAIAATTATLRAIARHILDLLDELLAPGNAPPQHEERLQEAVDALETTRRYIEQIPSDPGKSALQARYTAIMHLLDHLRRLANRCGQHRRIATLGTEHRLRRLARLLRNCCRGLAIDEITEEEEARTNRLRRILRDRRDPYRDATVAALVRGEIDADQALARLDSIRWLHRVSYHIWRIAHHLRRLEANEMAEKNNAGSASEFDPE